MEVLLLGMLNTPEIIMILVLALILFGAKKLPELAKGLGHGIKEFRKASREITEELNSAASEEPPPPPRRRPADLNPHTTEGVESQSPYGPGEGSAEVPAESSVPQTPGAEMEHPVSKA
jgi:sec-independent protein translocase protein TatA